MIAPRARTASACTRRGWRLSNVSEGQKAAAARIASDGEARPDGAAARGRGSPLKVYTELSKARLSALVVTTTAAGYLSAGVPFSLPVFASACAGTSLAAGAASCLNQVYEVERDRKMHRTRNRPLPSGRVGKAEALAFAGTASVASVALLYTGVNLETAMLGAGNIALYGGAYTASKPVTEWNTWVGAVVGAVPPVMGYCAATGDILSAESLFLGTGLFLWQFPHFFALAWNHRKDYARGGFQMVPVNDPDGTRTASLIMQYSLALSALPMVSCATGLTSWMFGFESLLFNGALVHKAAKFSRDRSQQNAREVFKVSLWYLPLMMALFLLHRKDHKLEAGVLGDIKAYLRGVCAHEVLLQTAEAEQARPVGSKLCPVKVGGDAVENSKKGGEAVVATIQGQVQQAP